jgi:hypothetical protein
MVLVKATSDSEASVMPTEKQLTEMMKFNEELVKAGVMLSGEGLHPTTKAKRVRIRHGHAPTVTDGPFAETKELVAGFWIWRVSSMEEAVAWAKRIPDCDSPDSEVELRQVFDADDFGAEMTPELRALDERLRDDMARA